jgi:propionyl-CoA synthetase
MFTAPTAFRAIKREDPKAELMKNYDLSNFKALFLAGERCDPDTLKWASHPRRAGDRPLVADRDRLGHRRQLPGPAPVAGQARLAHQGRAGLGRAGARRRLQAGGARRDRRLVVKLPLPPGCLPTLWQNDERFVESYLEEFPGYYKTADAGFIDDDGYAFVMSRIDDIINVAGHRLSTGGMEEVLADHPDVAECAVLGVEDQAQGQLPLGLVVLKAGVDRPTRRLSPR